MELVRRGRQLALLEEQFAAARQGEGRAALVTGSPGTGKSALLHDLADRAGRLGATVLRAAASPAEAELSLGVVGQLLSGVTSWAEARHGEPASVLHGAVRALAVGTPVVVVVDDVEHADEQSVRCLLYLCGRLAGLGVLLVMGAGPRARAEAAPPLGALLCHPRCTNVALERLDEDGVAAFLAASSEGAMEPGAAGRLAPAWHRVSGGNPRLLRALLDDHRACEPVRPSGPVAGTAYKRAVMECLRSASPDLPGTARALAVLADAATLTLLARLLGVHERTVGPHLDALDAMGLLYGGRMRHEGVRAAVLEELPADDCARLHTEAARLLYDSGADARTVARHLVAAGVGDGAPAWAAPLLCEAGRQAMEDQEPLLAAEFLRAARRADADAGQRAVLLERLARAEWESDPATVVRHLPELAADLGTRPPDAQRAAGVVGLLLWHGRITEATQAVAGLEPALDAGEVTPWLTYVSPETATAADHGTAGRTAGVSGAAERALQALAYDHVPLISVAAILSVLLHAGETERAAQWCTLLADADTRRATPARQAVVAAAAAVVHGRTGAHDLAARHAARALTLLRPAAWGVAIGMPLSAAVLAATRRGAHDEAARQLRVPVPDALFRTRAGLHYLLARGHHELAAGRARAALGDFHACRDLSSRWQLGDVIDWRTPAAEALRAHGDGPGSAPIDRLTRAERRVAVLAAHGCTNRGIAARLYVTPSTVEQHLTRIYRKLCVRSRADLAVLVAAGSGAG